MCSKEFISAVLQLPPLINIMQRTGRSNNKRRHLAVTQQFSDVQHVELKYRCLEAALSPADFQETCKSLFLSCISRRLGWLTVCSPSLEILEANMGDAKGLGIHRPWSSCLPPLFFPLTQSLPCIPGYDPILSYHE